jgi:SH3 domain-containing YSC84-like protein 1
MIIKNNFFAHIAAACLVTMTMAVFGWSQSDPSTQNDTSTTQNGTSTTTVAEPTSKPSPTAKRKADADKDKSDDDMAKFDKKNSDSKATTDIAKRLDASANVLDEIMATPDKAIPTNVLGDAKCIAVIPSMVNIAVVFGGRHGKGVATCRTATGWSAPAPVTITGGSWGLQVGGQATDLVMLVMNQRGMDHLLSSKFKIGAEATGAAGPVGRQVAADTDWKMKAEVLSYSRSRGAFIGIDLNGASLKQDKDETALLYGKPLAFETILSGKTAVPADAKSFLATVRKYSAEAAENKQGD